LQAERPNQVWALDFMFDTTADGRPFKVLSMCDEFTRESVGGRLGRSITADDVVAVLDQLRLQRGAPEYLRCDNGPEFIAAAIRDWCRFTGTSTSFIDPGSPWQNAYVEGFNGKARDELFAREIFDSILEARVLYEDWRHAYNLHRPHRALGLQPPAVFAAAFNNQKLSHTLDMDPLFWTRFVRIEPCSKGDGHAEGVRRRVPPAGGCRGPLRATSGASGS
jgi:putative transposase